MTLVTSVSSEPVLPNEPDELRRFELLQAGLDLINQGLTVFDGNLRLVAWNQRFFTLLEFPMEMARVGTPFADFMRINALRGEYGEGNIEEKVAERARIARSFKRHYMERARPNGTIVAVRGEPLPHGGFVTIYTDVTQQRYHERLIQERNEELDRRVRERTAELEATNSELKRVNAEQKRMEAALVQAQKMEAVGELTGGLAHDFNNLLTIVISNMASLRDRQGSSAPILEFVEPALVAAHKGADLTRRLLAFARRQALEPRTIEVNSLIANFMTLLCRSLPEPIRIASKPWPDNLHTHIDPQQLEHALLNLALNARDAMPRGGELVIRTENRHISEAEAAELEVSSGRYVEIGVDDMGVGMDAATLSRAFEPFFTTKEFGSGSGLGLSMVYGFVKQSGGAVRIRSARGEGTAVTLLLPASVAAVEAELPAPSRARTVARSSGLVLLVEDDAEVRKVIRRQLADIGHVVVEASTGEEALQIVESVPELSALVSDIVMPGSMDGRQLARLVREKRPELRIVLITGYAEGLESRSGADQQFIILRKPCTKEELGSAIEDAAP
jgi:signal transduction histidine kinase/CheY-like chemotaxis protein